MRPLFRATRFSSAAILFLVLASCAPAVLVQTVAPRQSSLAVGGGHACWVAGGGEIYCWGRNSFGQLGDGSRESRAEAAPVLFNQGEGGVFRQVSAGWNHTCALSAEGVAFCWGSNASGQLGDGTHGDRSTPTMVQQDHVEARFVRLEAGWDYTCGLTAPGQVYCWGGNRDGQLGTGTVEPAVVPAAVQQAEDGPALHFVSLTVGLGRTCALTEAGDAYCWGRGAARLEDGTAEKRNSPVRVADEAGDRTTFSHLVVSRFGHHVCGLVPDGRVFCWGSNHRGQLGDGTTQARVRPVGVDQSIDGGLRFTRIALGNDHSCALTTEGRVYCWGQGTAGQLGDGGREQRTVPTRISWNGSASTRFQSLTAGFDQSCATTNADGVFCWGRNTWGQLGDGTTEQRDVPTRVVVLP